MSQISAALVRTLRDRTNAPMMDCKSALGEAGGDLEKAVEILRKKSKDIQDKKASRETAEGRIAVCIDADKKVGALLEMRCESAPVAKSEQFTQLANDIAKQVALKDPKSVDELLSQPCVDDPKKTVNERISDVVGIIRENMKPARFARLTGLVGSYIHHDGMVGALVQVEGDKADPAVIKELLKEVCQHITFHNPVAANREQVDAAVVAKEKEIAKSQIEADPKNKGKPANILDKIVEGKLRAFFAANVLVEQPFVKDPTKTVGELLQSAGLKMGRFIRFKVGEIS